MTHEHDHDHLADVARIARDAYRSARRETLTIALASTDPDVREAVIGALAPIGARASALQGALASGTADPVTLDRIASDARASTDPDVRTDHAVLALETLARAPRTAGGASIDRAAREAVDRDAGGSVVGARVIDPRARGAIRPLCGPVKVRSGHTADRAREASREHDRRARELDRATTDRRETFFARELVIVARELDRAARDHASAPSRRRAKAVLGAVRSRAIALATLANHEHASTRAIALACDALAPGSVARAALANLIGR